MSFTLHSSRQLSYNIYMKLSSYCKIVVHDLLDFTGAVSPRVQWVHLHPLRFSNGCNAPVLKEVKKEEVLIWMQKSDFFTFEAAI